MEKTKEYFKQSVSIYLSDVVLQGDMCLPAYTNSLILFVHGSGSSRFSTRNQYVASVLQKSGHGTLLLDFLSPREEQEDNITHKLRFDIAMLSKRVVGVTKWINEQSALSKLNIGYFGASTGAAAALIATAQLKKYIGAVVSRGGRPDLAGDFLFSLQVPTLLIVGGLDKYVIELNEAAFVSMPCHKAMNVVEGAGHLFEEPGKLEEVARLANAWFTRYLGIK